MERRGQARRDPAPRGRNYINHGTLPPISAIACRVLVTSEPGCQSQKLAGPSFTLQVGFFGLRPAPNTVYQTLPAVRPILSTL